MDHSERKLINWREPILEKIIFPFQNRPSFSRTRSTRKIVSKQQQNQYNYKKIEGTQRKSS